MLRHILMSQNAALPFNITTCDALAKKGFFVLLNGV